ncbi:MAG: PilW family protein [Selenomonadaceae bacterium]
MVERQDETGMTLLELVVALPLVAMLLAGISTMFFLLLHSCWADISDLELQQQLRLAAVAVTQDMMYADRAKIEEDGISLWNRSQSSLPRQIVYRIRDPGGRAILTKNNQPLTGGSIYSDVRIVKFQCRKFNEKTIVMEIAGRNAFTGKILVVETAAVLENKRSGGGADE